MPRYEEPASYEPQRHAVDVDRIGDLEAADHESDQVRGHRHRVGEPHPDPAVTVGRPVDLGAVGECGDALGHDERHSEHGLQVGLIPAGERAPGVGGLELRRRDRVRAVVVGVGRPVEAVELVVELAPERHPQEPGARFDGHREREGRALQLLVVRHVGHRDLGADLGAHGRMVDREVERVHDDLVDPLVDVDLDLDGARERRRPEVGLEDQVVSGRDDGARKPVAILHGTGAYRAADAPCADASGSIDPRERKP